MQLMPVADLDGMMLAFGACTMQAVTDHGNLH